MLNIKIKYHDKNMPRHRIHLVEVSHIGRPPRGGYGSTGEL